MPYTAEDFVLVGSRDPKDIADFEKALAYLEKTPAGKRLLDDMLENRAVAVSINRVGENMVEHEDKVLFWDPSTALQILNEDDTAGGVISPALAFAHELAHYLDDTDYDIETYGNDKWDNDAERYAGQIEAELAEQLGEPVRGNHKGNVIEVPGVTHHTRENDDGTANWVWEDGNGNEREGPGYKPYPDPPDPIAGDGNEGGNDGSSEESDEDNTDEEGSDEGGGGEGNGDDGGDGGYGEGGGASGGDGSDGGGGGGAGGGNDDDEGELTPEVTTGEGAELGLVASAPSNSTFKLFVSDIFANDPASVPAEVLDANSSCPEGHEPAILVGLPSMPQLDLF